MNYESDIAYSYQTDPVSIITSLIITALVIAGMWLIFRKAGRHGWAAIVPFYNIYTLCKVAGKPGWWFILYIIPIVNIVIAILVAFGLARNFGRGKVFGFFLLFWPLPFIGYPILGFGSDQYRGEQGTTGAPAVSI